jgi:hypothetical protein
MYKCSGCNQVVPMVVVTIKGTKQDELCIDCLEGKVTKIAALDPPLGWQGQSESEVMWAYGKIGTRYFKGAAN